MEEKVWMETAFSTKLLLRIIGFDIPTHLIAPSPWFPRKVESEILGEESLRQKIPLWALFMMAQEEISGEPW